MKVILTKKIQIGLGNIAGKKRYRGTGLGGEDCQHTTGQAIW